MDRSSKRPIFETRVQYDFGSFKGQKLDPDRLAEARKKRSISQRDAAARIGVSQPAYSSYEDGSARPPVSAVLLLSLVFDVSAEWLYGMTDDPRQTRMLVDLEDADPTDKKFLERFNSLDERSREFIKYVMTFLPEKKKN